MVLAATFVPRSMNSGKDSRETPDGLQLGVARRRERSFGSFERSFQVPENIDADKISAGFKIRCADDHAAEKCGSAKG